MFGTKTLEVTSLGDSADVIVERRSNVTDVKRIEDASTESSVKESSSTNLGKKNRLFLLNK